MTDVNYRRDAKKYRGDGRRRSGSMSRGYRFKIEGKLQNWSGEYSPTTKRFFFRMVNRINRFNIRRDIAQQLQENG